MKKLYKSVIAICLFSGCSHSQVTIESSPQGAEVQYGDKVLGVTPLVMGEAQIEQIGKFEVLPLVIRKVGFVESKILVPLRSAEKFEIQLIPLDAKYFNESVAKLYTNELNSLVRDLLSAQGTLISGTLDESESKISELKSKYPNIAAVYVLSANLEIRKKNRIKAIENLERAKSLDGADPVVSRLYMNIMQTDGKPQ